MFGISERKIEAWGKKKKTAKLIKVLTHSKNELRAAAAKALGEIDSLESANALITALRDPDARVRLNAVISLGKIQSPLATEHLKSVTRNDSDPAVREEAAKVLGIIPRDDR